MKILLKLRRKDEIWDKYLPELQLLASVKQIIGADIVAFEDADIIITTRLKKEELKFVPNLKAVYLYKTGDDGLPQNDLKEMGVKIISSHINSGIIAEHALALALDLLHRVTEFHNDLKKGVWYADGGNYFWNSLYGMNIGIIGYGHIGRELAHIMRVFTNQIYAYNRTGIYDANVIGAGCMCEIAEKCELIFVCLPKNSETAGMIDSDMLEKMEGKYLVNISRAEVIDEESLYNAIISGCLKGYASDVWYQNPKKNERTAKVLPVKKFDFTQFRNVVMSPHAATHEVSAHERFIEDCINHVKKDILI